MAQLWQRDRASSVIIRGESIQFEAKFQVEGLCFAPKSMHSYMREWLYHNFAAGSFHTKKLCSRLDLNEIDFFVKK